LNEQKEFRNLFIRSNLSLTIESATDKDLVFASSFDGEDIPGDLQFEFYKFLDN